ncbi:ATP-binding protein [Petropleomorpha daqingensis]|uniref:ATP/maltotriose-dependent transcriptional regulator MalT n=1 Tax=Petropleomorpha daqingensis TaxID=2026353 RepID=A0A853CMK2_9ACTN|nr:ATP/maltotriose-dependent transcriptional regulator MalT [Petropleomorpha daqingensis]
MPARTALVASPVLVGRDDLLALADARLAATAGGSGGLLLVAGEAGIGKTRLLGAIGRRAERSGFAVLRAAAFPGDAESSGGVLLDLAGDLQRFPDRVVPAIGRAMADRLRAPATEDEDLNRRRRLLEQSLADDLADLPAGRPLLVVLEDLHWADQLSLEVVARVAARLPFRTTLVVGAYRSDELYSGTAIRAWRTRLLSSRLAEEIRLPRLTTGQVAVLTSAVLGRAAPGAVVTAIHDRSDGIPLHVEELLAVADPDATDVDEVAVPDTLADAVLLRMEVLGPAERAVAAAAAVIGRSFDFDLLTAVVDEPAEQVDGCLRRLQEMYLVQAGADATGYDFRHALIRDAVYADIALPRRRTLHQRVARAGVERGYPATFVSAHFEQAGLREEAHRHAHVAAARAAGLSAHREALQLYRRAVRTMPADLAPADRADLWLALGDEAAAADDNRAAAEAYATAHRLWAEIGDRVAAASVVPKLAAATHLLGDGLDRRAPLLEEALRSLSGVPDADRVRGRLLSALATVYMLDRRLDESLVYGDQSRALAQATGDVRTDLDTAATVGSVLVFAGRMDSGWSLLQTAVTRAEEQHYETEAARAYRMIGSSASVLVENERAENWLTRGIAYADGVELWNHRNYLAAHLAHVQWARGRWAQAKETAEHALADGRGGVTTAITGEYVLGYLALGRGEWEAATEQLTSALRQGEAMAELQRLSPPLWGLAETARLQGDHGRALELCARGVAASAEVADAAYLFPFLLTGVRAWLARGEVDEAGAYAARVADALLVRSIPGTLPAIPHARGLLALAAGDLAAARELVTQAEQEWRRRDRFWEGSWARLDLARVAVRARRTAEATSLATAVRTAAEEVGAQPLAAAADDVVPRGRRDEPWAPLSAREYTVASLVADGLTNREIAARLVLAPKTVSAHVEHILAKLGMARRSQIAAWTATVDADPRTLS